MASSLFKRVEQVQNVEKCSLQQARSLLTFTNAINVLLIIATSVFEIIFSMFNLPKVIFACYLLFFACNICCFEVRHPRIDQYFFMNAGFMYTWCGRFTFFLFVATIAMHLGTFGQMTALYTILNVCINLWVLCKHQGYRQWIINKNRMHMQRAIQKDQPYHQVDSDTVDIEIGEGIGSMDSSDTRILLDESNTTCENTDKYIQSIQETPSKLGEVSNIFLNNTDLVKKAVKIYAENPKQCNEVANVILKHKETLL